jgi:type 1 fimbria pilin
VSGGAPAKDYELTLVDTFEFDPVTSAFNAIVRLSNTSFMTATYGSGQDAYLETFDCDADGDNIATVETLNHDTTNGTYNSIAKIADNHYVKAWGSGGADGWVGIFSVDDDGQNLTEVDTHEHDTNQGFWNSVVSLDSSHFALAYSGGSNHGIVKVFSFHGS